MIIELADDFGTCHRHYSEIKIYCMPIITNMLEKDGFVHSIFYKYLFLLVAAFFIFSYSYAHPLSTGSENGPVPLEVEYYVQPFSRKAAVIVDDTSKAIDNKRKLRKARSYSFNDMRLSDILIKLERWFEVKFRYKDCLENKVYTITRIYNDEPIEKPLTLLEKLDAFSFIRSGDTILLYKKQEPNNTTPSK